MPKLKTETENNMDMLIYDYIQCMNGATLAEIAEFCELSQPAIYRYIKRLIKQGDIFQGIRREPNHSEYVKKGGPEYKELKCYYLEP